MKRKLILLLLVLIVSGCTAEYNLTIDNENFNEYIIINVPNTSKSLINQLTESEQYINDDLIYSKTIEQGTASTKFNYSHTYSFSDYQNRQNPCFGTSKIYQSNGYYTIFANKFSCFDSFDMKADSYKVKIQTNYKVINQNSDQKTGNTYTWNFNKENYKNKSVIFQYSKKEIEQNPFNILIPIIISFGIALLIFIVTRIVYTFIDRQKVGA